jgi:hypothetical protein
MTMTIHSGDKINASIMLVDAATHVWSIDIRDTTTGQKFHETFSYASSRLSAEWVVERPTINGGLSPLANFGSVSFSNAMAVNNATVEPISKFSSARITMYDRQNRQLVSVSSLGSDGASFSVSYIAVDSTMASSLQNHFEYTIAIAVGSGREKSSSLTWHPE